MQTRLRQVAFDLVQSFESYLKIQIVKVKFQIEYNSPLKSEKNCCTFGRSGGLNRALLEVRSVQSVQANSAMEGCHVFLKMFRFSPRSFCSFFHPYTALPLRHYVTGAYQSQSLLVMPAGFFLPFLRFLERPNGLIERLQFHDFHVVFFTVLCSLQFCCESVSILSKSFECHMLGVWRTRHRCQSSHFPRDCVVTYLFKIQSPSLHLSLFLKWMRMHCFKQLLADRR